MDSPILHFQYLLSCKFNCSPFNWLKKNKAKLSFCILLWFFWNRLMIFQNISIKNDTDHFNYNQKMNPAPPPSHKRNKKGRYLFLIQASFRSKTVHIISLIKVVTMFWQIHIYKPLFLIPKPESKKKRDTFSLQIQYRFIQCVYTCFMAEIFICLIKVCSPNLCCNNIQCMYLVLYYLSKI